MAKFSKAFLGTLLATTAYANENFKVASCNDDSAERRPALTIEVAEGYYTNNLSGQEGFALADGFYSKTIAEDDLEFTFSDDPDEIILSYTLATTGGSATDFDLDDSTTISFGGDSSITFQCRYSRNVSVSQDISVIDTPTDAVEGTGDFTYSMSITVGGPGGTTDVVITPNHNFDEIAPRLINCNVAHDAHSIYPIHSFNNDQLCFDKSRLDVMQSVFGPNIEFSMRTFLFKTLGSSAEEQQQTISCNLHLDPAASVSSTEPEDCSCYSEEECAVPAVPAFTNLPADAQQRTLSSGKQIFYASYEKKFYDEAVDLCASHGAEIVLPVSQQENLEVRDFLNETRAVHGPQVNILGVLLRVVNSGYPSANNYVDAKDNSALGWDGDFGDVGGNRGIWDYSEVNHYRGFMEPGNRGTWKGLKSEADHPQRECEVICELPSV